MSRSPYWAPAMRWGARMNDAKMVDAMVGALSDPFDDCHMGVTAENVAKKWNDQPRGPGRAGGREPPAGGQRNRQAATSKRRSCRSRSRSRAARSLFDIDENVRGDTTVEKLARLRPVFDKSGTVTAGNASSINDAAAAVVLMERGAGRAAAASSRWAGWSPTATPASSRSTWASARCRR